MYAILIRVIKILPVQMSVVITSYNKAQINPANSMSKSVVSDQAHKLRLVLSRSDCCSVFSSNNSGSLHFLTFKRFKDEFLGNKKINFFGNVYRDDCNAVICTGEFDP